MSDNTAQHDDDIAQLGYALGYAGLFSSDPFGIRDCDRTNHLYMVGKTGTGKSTMLENLWFHRISWLAKPLY